MEIEPSIQTNDPSSPTSPPVSSSQRVKYEAEVRVFISRYGRLEDVRKNLGLSRRKICQLLLVDPSAWSRWHAPGGRPPPHIYRMLEWYLALEGKSELHPRLADLYVRGARAAIEPGRVSEAEVNELCRQVRLLKRLVWIGPTLAGLILLARFVS